MNTKPEVNLLPNNDIDRLTALARYKIIHTPPENSFDHITKLAAKIFKVPMSLISFVDEDEIFFKSLEGIYGLSAAPREKSLCAFLINKGGPIIIENVASESWANTILAEYNLGVEFYASVPLVTPDGFTIGTLCIMDIKARLFDKSQIDILEDLAGVVMHELETRLSGIEQVERQLKTNARMAEARREKEKAEDMLHFSVEAATLGICYIDRETRAFMPSPKLKEFYGYNAEDELTYEAALAAIVEEYRDQVIAATEATMARGDLFNMEYPIIKDSKSVRWLKGVGRLYYDSISNTSSFLSVVIDITEQKENEVRKNDFISMISQELKTSLSLLRNDAKLMYFDAKKRKDLGLLASINSMQLQAKKMNIMINSFLHTSQPETCRIHLNPYEFNLHKLLNEVVEETMMMYPNCTIKLSYPGRMAIVNGDREKIGQVLSNFLITAIKYSKVGESINLEAEYTDDQVIIGIKTVGKGLNQQDVVRLFDYFHQGGGNPPARISDFGMELYQCAEIIKHHNGRVWMESGENNGSASFFSLPLL